MTEKDSNTIAHILQHCERIGEITDRFGNDFESYSQDPDYRDALHMNLMQIGELVTHLSDAFIQEHSEISWKSIKGFRNIIAHDYSNVEPETVWGIISEDLPILYEYCNKLRGA